MYTLEDINNKEDWNNFIINSNLEFYSFLQSWEWGEFQKMAGKYVFRKGIYGPHPKTLLRGEGSIVGIIQIILVNARRGNYLFIPHGPLIDGNFFKIFNETLPELINLAKQNNCSFIRFNSALKNTIENKNIFKSLGFINAPMHEHAEDTHLLDLTITEDELLNNIKKKDRYYINRAIKEGVTIRIDNKKDHIESLIKMHQSHAIRDNGKHTYSAFSTDFINNLYKSFKNNISTISASFNGQIESILMTIKFGKTCVYYIAASNIKNPKFSPNYLCQWEAIKNAKKMGAENYNFWGVSPDSNPKHPIAGVTIFKRKFSGYDYSLLHAQDLILSPKYYLNWCIETFRRLKRGYYYKKPE